MAIFRDQAENHVEHDRSIEDRRRHRQLVEKSIKENLGDILSEESIICLLYTSPSPRDA